jgi:methylmalonyl-CoA decarboxylase
MSSTTSTTHLTTPPELLTVERTGDVATITLRNERKRNALCCQLLDELVAQLDDMAAQRTRVVVLRAGADVEVWSSGHDIRELPRDGSDPLRYADPLERALRAIRKHPAPVVAMVHGTVWGGATDLVLSCDFVVADYTASFAITPVNLGLPYNASGIQNVINRVGQHLAKQMFFTAEPLVAAIAHERGIINYLVDPEALEARTYRLANHLATKSPHALAVIKEQIRIMSEANPVSATTFERIEELRRQAYDSADYREGISAFIEKRHPSFSGIDPDAPTPAAHY